jgi:ABC-type transport system involved in multi-copper enzyme maturation permease subunit
MKQLFWKELMEARFLPICLPMLSGMVLVLWYNLLLSGLFIPFGCLLIGLVAGCSSIASEYGRGTIRFLSSLPLSRKHVWLCKFAALALVSFSTFVLILIGGLCFGSGLFTHPQSLIDYKANLVTDVGFLQWWIVPLSMTLFGLSCSVFSSTLVDRPLTAIILSTVTAVALPTVFLRFTSGYESFTGMYWSTFNYIVLDALACVLLVSSYVAFSFGKETGINRPAILGAATSGSLLVGLSLFLLIVGVLLPQRSDDSLGYTYSESSPPSRNQAPTIILDCPDASINHSYVLQTGLQLSAIKTATIESDDNDIVAKIDYPVEVFDISPLVSVVLRTDGQIGKKHYRLRVLNKYGNLAESILINVTKVTESGRRTR